MRFLYALVAMVLWAWFMGQLQGISPDMELLSFSIVVAGAMAGGD